MSYIYITLYGMLKCIYLFRSLSEIKYAQTNTYYVLLQRVLKCKITYKFHGSILTSYNIMKYRHIIRWFFAGTKTAKIMDHTCCNNVR